jgi:RimJ/RimL family protein N-acetyltransferase
MSCKLRQAENAEEVRAILTDADIFERIAEEGHSAEDFDVPFDGKQCYMIIEVEGKNIGVWCIYPVNRTTLNIHCNILKEYRNHGMAAGKLILDWFANESPEQYKKLNAEIPVIYPDVYYFTKKFGFEDEGINRQSIVKNGELVDQYRLGLTRSEAFDYVLC